MAGWSQHKGLGVALSREGIDTDQLIPARFMSAPRSEGYGRFLLHDLRRTGETPDPEFPLNRPAAEGASVLVAARNFGGGSSREAAVYALVDAGFRVVIAPSFGDIFAGNAVNNGLLPALVSEADGARLLAALAEPTEVSVDLESCRIQVRDIEARFEIEPVRRTKLIKGWDDIDLTQAHADQIAAFRAKLAETRPWVFPDAEA
ncbi:MAG: 3-isopropylmalate dehydratase small subunit [Rhodobacteraceae bacterium]|nr:3-isopropylmalate dehydratase small subunit [Paracoccaceae bacterium]